MILFIPEECYRCAKSGDSALLVLNGTALTPFWLSADDINNCYPQGPIFIKVYHKDQLLPVSHVYFMSFTREGFTNMAPTFKNYN